jgi:hypothetical protein
MGIYGSIGLRSASPRQAPCASASWAGGFDQSLLAATVIAITIATDCDADNVSVLGSFGADWIDRVMAGSVS